MALIEKCVLLMDNLSTLGKANKLIKAILVSYFILLGNTLSVAQQLWRVEISNNQQTHVIALRNLVDDKLLMLPTDNITIADYDILKSIDFHILATESYNKKLLKIQALQAGAVWICNVNLASKEEVNAQIQAVDLNKGIWASGYLKNHAYWKTYKILQKYLKRNRRTIDTKVGFINSRKTKLQSTTNSKNTSSLKNREESEKDNLIKSLSTSLDSTRREKTKDSLKQITRIAKLQADSGFQARRFAKLSKEPHQNDLYSARNVLIISLWNSVFYTLLGLLSYLGIKVNIISFFKKKATSVDKGDIIIEVHIHEAIKERKLRSVDMKDNDIIEKEVKVIKMQKTEDGKYSYKYQLQ